MSRATDTPDYYRGLRQPLHCRVGPQSTRMGRFEPLNAVIFLAADVATELRRIDPDTLTSVEEPGSPTLARFPTFLHEIIHWWQHAATTSGLIQGLSVAAQSISTARYLNDVGDGFAKPLLVALPDDAPVDHPAFLACHRWTECELGSGLLANPKRSARFVHTYPRYFRSVGASVLLLYTNVMQSVASDLDAGVDAIDMPGVSPEVLDRFVKDYFAKLALYDLSRQWLGSVGEFRFDFSWKPQVPEQERDYLKTLFADNFGLSLAQIPTL